LVEQSLTGIYIFDEEYFIYVNNRLCEMFGYAENEIVGKLKPSDLIAKEDLSTVNNHIKDRLTGKVNSVHYTARGNKKDGQTFWVEIHGTVININDDKVITGTILDITERKTAEQIILNNNAVLEQKVIERTSELETRVLEIQRINKLFIGRELRMKELKEKIKELEMGAK
jgi:PAS domain S-box-containing protein